MTKSIYGQGSVYRRSVDGRWYGALDIGGATGRRRRVTVSGASREAVEVRLARLHRRQRSAADEMTLADWLCRWRDELLPGTVAAESTVDNYAWAIDHHLVPGLGKILLIDLSPADVAVFPAPQARGGTGRPHRGPATNRARNRSRARRPSRPPPAERCAARAARAGFDPARALALAP
jgi:hypothetical protein